MRVSGGQDSTAAMPATTPQADELILYPNKFKWALYVVLSIGLGWLMISLQDQLPDIRGWLAAGAVLSSPSWWSAPSSCGPTAHG